MKKCELCKLPARLYCESDQASLCAGCDLKVHEANFLVARHSRTLLCRTCQAPTPWEASGARLGNTTTECDKCVEGEKEEIEVGVDEVFIDGDSDGSGEDEIRGGEDEIRGGEDEEEEEEEEGENQVVPWSYSPSPTPPPASSSSSSDGYSSSSSACASRTLSLKRMRQSDADRQPQNDLVASTTSAVSPRRLSSCGRRRRLK